MDICNSNNRRNDWLVKGMDVLGERNGCIIRCRWIKDGILDGLMNR